MREVSPWDNAAMIKNHGTISTNGDIGLLSIHGV